MRSLASEITTALAARGLAARDFVWIEARDRETGETVADGQWSDIGTTTVEVINPETGGAVSRTFYGSGTLTKISDIVLTSTISAQPITISMSQVAARVEALLRGYDVKLAPVQVFRGLLSLETRRLVAPAVPRFVGFIDRVDIPTPAEGTDAVVEITCNSHTQEMLRSSPELRSHESQLARLDGDAFYQDTSVVPLWEHFWGKQSGKLPMTAGRDR